MNTRIAPCWLLIALTALAGCAGAAIAADTGAPPARAAGPIDEATLDRARAELRRALKEEPKFVKVHAAEALLEMGIGENVKGVFEQERRLHEAEVPYRIGIWRVLARTSATPAERQEYIDKIRASYKDPKSPDPENAVETLSKLEYAIPAEDRAGLQAWTDAVQSDRRSYGRWLLAVSGGADDLHRLANLLKDPDPVTRGAAAYALAFLAKRVTPDIVTMLESAAEKTGAKDKPYVVGVAYVFTRDAEKRRLYREQLIGLARTGTKDGKYEVLNCLADRGDAADVPLLVELLGGDPEPDVRLNAARALLHIDRRLRSGGA